MEKSELRRLIKLEERMKQIATEDFGMKFCDIEFDIIPPQKMLEIMAYHNPTNISNWKYGRNYERLRTIYENVDPGLPYEVVINSDPSRAYLMASNTFAVQALVIAHVIGHVNFFTENKFFINSRKDIIEFMSEAKKRFDKYERIYGIDEVETFVDAAHSIYLHSSPFESETEMEKRDRIFKQKMRKENVINKSEFSDLLPLKRININEDIHLHNQKLKRALMLKTPVEPTEDLLRYIIDNSHILEDWQKDVLETLRIEGQYYWPIIRTKYMNEGWATFLHEKIMTKLFQEDLLNISEHSQFNYSNSLVKAKNPFSMNPYHIGCAIWNDIEERWNKGKHGEEYNNIVSSKQKDEWDIKENKGIEKCFEIMRSYTDWFFVQDFLTPELVDKMDLYIYTEVEKIHTYDYVKTKHSAKEVAEIIISSFAHSGVPKIEIIDGNFNDKGELLLVHRWAGANLDVKFAEETLKHICKCWGKNVQLITKIDDKPVIYKHDNDKTNIPKSPLPYNPSSNGLNPMDKNFYIIVK